MRFIAFRTEKIYNSVRIIALRTEKNSIAYALMRCALQKVEILALRFVGLIKAQRAGVSSFS